MQLLILSKDLDMSSRKANRIVIKKIKKKFPHDCIIQDEVLKRLYIDVLRFFLIFYGVIKLATQGNPTHPGFHFVSRSEGDEAVHVDKILEGDASLRAAHCILSGLTPRTDGGSGQGRDGKTRGLLG